MLKPPTFHTNYHNLGPSKYCYLYGAQNPQRSCSSYEFVPAHPRKDKHANYVVQCILTKGRHEDKRSIVQTISKNVLEFSKNKASTVERMKLKLADMSETAYSTDPL